MFRAKLFVLMGLALSFAAGSWAADDLAEIRSEIKSMRDNYEGEIKAMREAYESRIAGLESQMKTMQTQGVQQRDASQKVNAALAQKSDAATSIAPPKNVSVSSTSKISLGGYTEFAYIDRTTRTPQFDQLRTVVDLGAKIDERIHLYLELEQEHGGSIEAGGEEGQGEIEVEQAYIDYTVAKAITFRAGITLVPVGHYNEYHEGFLNNFTDRPLVDRRVIPTTWFEEGVGFYGTPVDNDYFGLSYEAYMFNPAAQPGVDPVGGFRGIRNEGNAPTNDQKAAAARVAVDPFRNFKGFADTFELGVSGYVSGFHGFTGANADGDTVHLNSGLLNVTAFDVTYEKKNFGFRGEAALDHTGAGENSTGKAQAAWGYYAEGYYKFWPCFLNNTPFGKFKDPKLVAAVRYDYVNLNTEAPATPSIQRVTAGISYRPLPRTVFKFDYQYDWLGSGIVGQDYDELKELETGAKKHDRAFLFSVSTGF